MDGCEGMTAGAYLADYNLNSGFLCQGRALTFRQLQYKFYISVLGFEKCSGVNVFMARKVHFLIKMLIVGFLGLKIRQIVIFSCSGVEKLCFGG